MTLILSILFSLSVFASEPVRPNYQDVSVKVFEGKMQETFKWYRGKVASQVERDAMQDYVHAVALPDIMRSVRSVYNCKQAYSFTVTNVSKVWSKLNTGYEDNSLLSKIWEINGAQGRHYSLPNYALLKIRDCLLKVNPAELSISTGLLDLLNLSLVNNKFIKGASFVVQFPTEVYSQVVARSFPVQIKTPQKNLTEAQHALLHKTHEAHKAVTLYRCGKGPKPVDGVVDLAHQEFERSAVDKEQLHFFSMKRFSGAVDPMLPPGYECQIAKLQDKFHETWMNHVGHTDRATAWKMSRRAEGDHQMAHVMMNIYEPKALFQFSCEKKRVLDCPVWDYEEAYSAMAKLLP